MIYTPMYAHVTFFEIKHIRISVVFERSVGVQYAEPGLHSRTT